MRTDNPLNVECKTIQGTSEFLKIIKKSRFVAMASRADNPEEAFRFLENKHESDATHNCWAYKINHQYRFNDDGEPAGSAGKPIYLAIENNGLDRVVILVIRYFGGIKLGIGGLARAYGQMADSVLKSATTHIIQKYAVIRVTTSFAMIHNAYLVFEGFSEITSPAPQFSDDGVSFTLTVPDRIYHTLAEKLINATKGNVSLKILETDYL
jgi:putative IMPACT (imprinted ancient) family translation regulator